MKKILIIIFWFNWLTLFSQDGAEPVVHPVRFYDTIKIDQPIIFQKGDTCEIFIMNNDSIVMVCNKLDTVRVDNKSDFNSIKINNLQSKDSDSIIVDSTIFFSNSIKIKTNTESFSANKIISYSDQHYVEYTITSNTVITVSNIPQGSNPQLALIWSGGDYTASISGATQSDDNSNSGKVLQQVNGATDLIQFKMINNTIYYWITNVVIP